MVAVINCSDVDVNELLDYRSHRGKRRKVTISWPRRAWAGAKPHLALLVDEDGVVAWLGRAKPGPTITDRDRRIEIVDIEDLGGVSFEDIEERLPERNKGSFKFGVLPDATGRAVVTLLLEMFPSLRDTFTFLSRPDDFFLPRGSRGRVLNEQRDGIGVLLEVGGVGREPLRRWSPSQDAPSFLADIEQRPVSEETLINHDIRRFPGLVEASGVQIDWRVFEGNDRQMFIMNANTEPLEHTLGIDVVYYNETFGSFVLVQYKRLAKEASDDGRLWYRPDGSLSSELARMNEVDRLFGSAPGEFRLYSQACWVKLCNPDGVVNDPLKMITGMYLTREHFVEALNTCKGPRGGIRIGYENVRRHITNTLFIELVKDGWVGTRGTGTEDLAQVFRSVLSSRRTLVFGTPLLAPVYE